MQQSFIWSNDNVDVRTNRKFCVDHPFPDDFIVLDIDIDSAKRMPKESSAIKE